MVKKKPQITVSEKMDLEESEQKDFQNYLIAVSRGEATMYLPGENPFVLSAKGKQEVAEACFRLTDKGKRAVAKLA